jgi:bifunctional UDP-N-acetylglucosamine pyrophosphorylase/glucosamine-1-phosphate N-acetyltransferase
MSDLTALVLAAGQSRRMQSPLSKILHPVAGRPLLHYPVAAALAAGASEVVVVTSPKDRETVERYLGEAFGASRMRVTVQDPPRGTGHAAQVGLEAASATARRILIVYGDVPLLDVRDLERLAAASRSEEELALGTCRLSDPRGYGRILRNERGVVTGIVEQKDLKDASQAAINEINAGLYAVSIRTLRAALEGLSNDNAQGEYYLTDILNWFARHGSISAVDLSEDATLGVNDRSQLCMVQDRMFARIAERHRLAGSSISSGVRIDDAVTLGKDVTLHAGVHLRGSTEVGDGSTIDVGCVLEDTRVGAGVTLLPYSVLSHSEVGPACQLGPFTHVRPGCVLEADVKLGNFVETKATRMRRGAKANHLSYLGDGDVGENTNIGAGTIFCNYDGYSKQKTTIGRDVFIGSDSQLIAPLKIGDGAYVATASTVTEDVPADALAIGRVKQSNKAGYAPKLRARLSAAKRAASGGKLDHPAGHTVSGAARDAPAGTAPKARK